MRRRRVGSDGRGGTRRGQGGDWWQSGPRRRRWGQCRRERRRYRRTRDGRHRRWRDGGQRRTRDGRHRWTRRAGTGWRDGGHRRTRNGGHRWNRDGGHRWNRDGGHRWNRDGGQRWDRDGGQRWDRGIWSGRFRGRRGRQRPGQPGNGDELPDDPPLRSDPTRRRVSAGSRRRRAGHVVPRLLRHDVGRWRLDEDPAVHDRPLYADRGRRGRHRHRGRRGDGQAGRRRRQQARQPGDSAGVPHQGRHHDKEAVHEVDRRLGRPRARPRPHPDRARASPART